MKNTSYVPTLLLSFLLLFSSCSKKKENEQTQQERLTNFQPAADPDTDTTGTYVSPTDFFSDNSAFDNGQFRPTVVKYKGERKLFYLITSHMLLSGTDSLLLVVENLSGEVEGRKNDGQSIIIDTSTVSRILFYLNGKLYFRKAFPVTLYDSLYFQSVRLFNKVFFDVSQSKMIVYFWTDDIPYGKYYNNNIKREYRAVSVDREGVIFDLTGVFQRINDNIDGVRFISEDTVIASIVPNNRYRNVAIDVSISIDWEESTSLLNIPSDTIFAVSGKPIRYFSKSVKLYSDPINISSYKVMKLQRATKAQLLKLYAPSVVNKERIGKDRLFVQFSRTNKGWVEFDSMVFEEIIAEK